MSDVELSQMSLEKKVNEKKDLPIRVTVSFPSNEYEWMIRGVKEMRFDSIAHAVRYCIATVMTYEDKGDKKE